MLKRCFAYAQVKFITLLVDWFVDRLCALTLSVGWVLVMAVWKYCYISLWRFFGTFMVHRQTQVSVSRWQLHLIYCFVMILFTEPCMSSKFWLHLVTSNTVIAVPWKMVRHWLIDVCTCMMYVFAHLMITRVRLHCRWCAVCSACSCVELGNFQNADWD